MKKIFLMIFLLIIVSNVYGKECNPGYKWVPTSGAGCVQIDCDSIPDAHYSYTKTCVCGSSGSIYEKDTDPNIECHRPSDYSSCPNCVYACVHKDEPCPGDDKKTSDAEEEKEIEETGTTDNYQELYDLWAKDDSDESGSDNEDQDTESNSENDAETDYSDQEYRDDVPNQPVEVLSKHYIKQSSWFDYEKKAKDGETCNQLCVDNFGNYAMGDGTPPDCRCRCKDGSMPDEKTLVCEPDCNYECEHLYGWEAQGTWKFPDCLCTCEKNYKPNAKTLVCEIDCKSYCKDALGEHGIQTKSDGDCGCTCEDGYEKKEGKCEQTCDAECKEFHGEHAKGTVTNGVCKCDCEEPYDLNPEMECVVCNEDTNCEPERGERCNTCSDCKCFPPLSKCNPDPDNPITEFPMELPNGCYHPKGKDAKEEECKKMRKEYFEEKYIYDEVFDYISHGSGFPYGGYDKNDPVIGMGKPGGKLLQDLGFVDKNWNANPYKLMNEFALVGTHYIQSRKRMYEEFCDKKVDDGTVPHTNHFAGKFNSPYFGNGNSVLIAGPGTYYGNGIKHVTTPNGQKIFHSEYEIIVEEDSETVKLIEGNCTIINLDGDIMFLKTGEMAVVTQDDITFPIKFDTKEMDEWWNEKGSWNFEYKRDKWILGLAVLIILIVGVIFLRKKRKK